MAGASIQMDYLSSLLMSYHIICTSTLEGVAVAEDNKARALEGVAVAEDEKAMYRHYFEAGRIGSFGGLVGESRVHDTLETLLDDTPDIPHWLRNGLLHFERGFREYWAELTSEIGMILASRQELLDDTFDDIHRIGGCMLGRETWLCDEPTIYVLGGLAMEASGTERGQYCYMSVPHLSSEERFLRMFIHEYVGHEFARVYDGIHEELFGGVVYEIDEGFAKLVSNKILEEVLGKPVAYAPFGVRPGPGYNTEMGLSFHVFNDRWLDFEQGAPFEHWYAECLSEIASRLPL